MKNSTIEGLNKLNLDFYIKVGKAFSTTRERKWEGWDDMWTRLIKYMTLEKLRQVSFLDLGCGNGRLIDFLVKSGFYGKYFGVDANQDFVQQSNEKLIHSDLAGKVFLQDFVDSEFALDLNPDIACLFGVLHHIPCAERRIQLISKIITHFKPSLLVFTIWNFQHNQRLISRKLDFSTQIAELLFEKYNLDSADFEKGDYILDWQKTEQGYRYVHNFTQLEIETIAEKAKIQILDTFSPNTGDVLNKYFICRPL